MREKFERGEDTDLTVRYGNGFQYSKRAHRIVLAAACSRFNNAIATQPADSAVLHLTISDKEVAEVILDCIYSKSYTDHDRTSTQSSQLDFNIDIYYAAIHNSLNDITRIAASEFAQAVTGGVSKDETMSATIAAIKRPDQMTIFGNPVLRPVIAKLCVFNHVRLFKHADFRPMLRIVPDLETDIAYAFANSDPEVRFIHRGNDIFTSSFISRT